MAVVKRMLTQIVVRILTWFVVILIYLEPNSGWGMWLLTVVRLLAFLSLRGIRWAYVALIILVLMTANA